MAEQRPDEPQKPAALRSDAQRNRERILEVALAEMTRDPEVPLSAIARAAGVGQGTFYRNFPSRDALVLEVFRHEMTQVAESAGQLLRTMAPDEALRAWMDRLAEHALAKAGLMEALRRAMSATGAQKPSPADLMAAVSTLLTAGQEAGTIRTGVTAEDFFYLIAGLFSIPADEQWKERSTRLLDLVMDSLRTGAPS
ncbi:TetR/AcrR family transcriptional regulator [Streptomyces sp. TRM66268-LWL]|uniref:TetR/AcrR family transcriptional regulator n=1 Tax=Streptomyces polyasparticus TaxID=2767826 RepID=A0ABR7SCX4_9ACTN|nr:TetR/AcrR family transcriptional regulator [Streptomyces polyasparticus]MBC9713347.1 TetR/AcrR family transcriptional regulator [Streptomyces polyasparticus]